MPQTGLYHIEKVDATPELLLTDKVITEYTEKTFPGEGAVECSRQVELLSANGDTASKVSTGSSHAGAFISGSKLFLNGKEVADNNIAVSGIGIIHKAGTPHIDTLDMLPNTPESDGRCVNITLSDYNTLRAGGIVKGYKKYDPFAVYNITDNVDTDVAYYTNTSREKDLLYNNIFGLPSHNEETEQTFLSMEAPHLSVYEPSGRITPGSYIELDYMVDTRRMKALTGYVENGVKLVGFGDTFTVTVRDSHDRVLWKKTTYAGVIHCKFGPFNDTGEDWYSIQCVDNHGCGSPVQYFDFLVKEPEDLTNRYNMTREDLDKYNIKPAVRENGVYTDYLTGAEYVDDNVVAYRNKKGLSALLKAVKKSGYSCITLYNPYADKTLESNAGKDFIYFIDYHQNIGTADNINLGGVSYRLAHVSTVNGKKQIESWPIEQGSSFTVNGESVNVDCEPIDWIIKDGAKLYRDANGKVKVYWEGYDMNPEVEVNVSSGFLCGKPWRDMIKVTDGVPGWAKYSDGYYYCIDNQVYDINYAGGEWVEIPSDFTLDMNDCVWRGSYAEDIQSAYNLIRLFKQSNTHVMNGHAEGLYDRYNFKPAFIKQCFQTKENRFLENGSNMSMIESPYSSIENMESCYSTGFEGHASIVDSNTTALSYYYANKQMLLGYIDYNGVTQHPEPIQALSANSSDRYRVNHSTDPNKDIKVSDGTDSISLVYLQSTISINRQYRTLRMATSGGYGVGVGKQHEYFIVFYHHDGSFAKTVKSSLWYPVKVPKEVIDRCLSDNVKNYQIRICGYGLSRIVDGVREVSPSSSWSDTSKSYSENHEKSKGFELALIHAYTDKSGKYNVYKNCYWHDSRSCVMTGTTSRNTVYDGCRFERIALEHNFSTDSLAGISGSSWYGTRMVADWEEGWQLRDTITLKNCTCDAGISHFKSSYDGIDLEVVGSASMRLQTARNVKIVNCNGFTLQISGLESALIRDNILRGYNDDYKHRYERPCRLLSGNKIRTIFNIQYKDNSQTKYIGSYLYRYNRCDDSVMNVVGVTDTLAKLSKDFSSKITVIARQSRLEGKGSLPTIDND